jgi:hypothetical protein
MVVVMMMIMMMMMMMMTFAGASGVVPPGRGADGAGALPDR